MKSNDECYECNKRIDKKFLLKNISLNNIVTRITMIDHFKNELDSTIQHLDVIIQKY